MREVKNKDISSRICNLLFSHNFLNNVGAEAALELYLREGMEHSVQGNAGYRKQGMDRTQRGSAGNSRPKTSRKEWIKDEESMPNSPPTRISVQPK